MKTFQEFLDEDFVPMVDHDKEAKRHADRAANFKGNDQKKYKDHRDAQKAHELAASLPTGHLRNRAARKAVSASEYAADV